MLRNLPVLLSALLIAAHFLRVGALGTVVLCLAFPALLWVRRPWAIVAVRAILVLASLEWLRTLWSNATERIAAGEPWARMAVILGAVAAFTALSAVWARGRPAAGDAPGADPSASTAEPPSERESR